MHFYERAKNKVKIGFLIPKQLISFPKNDSIQLKPAKNAIDVRLNHPSSVFLNEQIELSIFLNKYHFLIFFTLKYIMFF